ncbi:MAG TPA: AMP-binding protein [Pseudonocardiaceae bacterium]
MTGTWEDLIRGGHWRSPDTVWVEDGSEHSWRQVDEVASEVAATIRAHPGVRVVHLRSDSKLGCFAGQLGAWRAGCVAIADDGNLGPAELDHVRPDLAVSVDRAGATAAGAPGGPLPADRLPAEVVTVNFTSGTTGSRRAVAVTSENLLALARCRDLAVPRSGARPVAGSFATPTYDGWWFDTWRTVADGGTVVCLPDMNEDVFDWPELTRAYGIDRVLLPAAVVVTLVEAAPECVADVPWLFSGGEQFQASTYRQARRAGLTGRLVNLYGPTEATFATHGYRLPEPFTGSAVPIGRPIEGCRQTLRHLGGPDGGSELVVSGPLVCLGYLERGTVARRFTGGDGQPSFRTGDVVRPDEDGNLVFIGRLDNQIKVNGMRVDAAALEHHVTSLSDVVACRIVQDGQRTVAFVLTTGSPGAPATLSRIESVVTRFSPAITVRLVDRFPTQPGGKVDTTSLMDQHRVTDKGGQS